MSKSITFPILVIFHEKHGEGRYICYSLEGLGKMSLDVVLEREEYFGGFGYEESIGPIEPTPPPEDAQDYLKQAYELEKKSYNNRMRSHKIQMSEKALLEKAKRGNGEAAFAFLKARRDYEYEDFEIVEFQDIKSYK